VLGVAKMVDGMIMGLRIKDSQHVPDSVHQRVRLAGLLHDCGHVLFSHLGETIVSDLFFEELAEAKAVAPQLFEGEKLGEVISYLAVTSPSFAEPFDAMAQRAGLHDVDIGHIAPLIVGRSLTEGQQFEADIISGPFDADKLDYLLRDCHFSGIRSTVDVERIFYTVRLLSKEGTNVRSLGFHLSGVPNLEQLIIAKLMLFPAVYQHQKVRALECTFRGIAEQLVESAETIEQPELNLRTLVHWLALGEDTLQVLGLRENTVAPMVRKLMNRDPLRRALVISRDTVTDPGGLTDLLWLADMPSSDIRAVRDEIWDEVPRRLRLDIHDLWLDVPKPPNSVVDIEQISITVDQRSTTALSNDMFQWSGWTENFANVKWHGHVFCPNVDNTRKAVAAAAKRVLRRRYGLRFKPEALRWAHNREP
jgi:HD superfamily phosphohydrolase